MRRFLIYFVFLPIAILVVVLSVANRDTVTLSLDPIGGGAPGWSVSAPFYVFLFAAVALGVVIGGVATWFRQGRWRRVARSERANAERLRGEVGHLRERLEAAQSVGGKALAPPRVDRDAA